MTVARSVFIHDTSAMYRITVASWTFYFVINYLQQAIAIEEKILSNMATQAILETQLSHTFISPYSFLLVFKVMRTPAKYRLNVRHNLTSPIPLYLGKDDSAMRELSDHKVLTQ
uniref:Uncharacterized protein n=1 Tax=Glossina brevipalpis TaxID=37001 RepID=A0A1A9WNV0_9MUSC